MLSKNKTKLITSLAKKKGREKEGLFLAEGTRLVAQLLASHLACRFVLCTPDWLAHEAPTARTMPEIIPCSAQELREVSQQISPQDVLAVFEIPTLLQATPPLHKQVLLYLDHVQDPGNMGTLLRLADWFGIEHVACSVGCADVWSPKVVQASMGAIAGVQVWQNQPYSLLTDAAQAGYPVYGAFLEGENVYTATLSQHGILVLGNEGNGISALAEAHITRRLTIPSFHAKRSSESLNVAMAASILCSEFKRPRQ